jgi:UTP--glucose-1-phosphate uridylyltransferase
MYNKIKKAVFPVAGHETCFLSVTKVMPKKLLLVVGKPLIQYAAKASIVACTDTLNNFRG